MWSRGRTSFPLLRPRPRPFIMNGEIGLPFILQFYEYVFMITYHLLSKKVKLLWRRASYWRPSTIIFLHSLWWRNWWWGHKPFSTTTRCCRIAVPQLSSSVSFDGSTAVSPLVSYIYYPAYFALDKENTRQKPLYILKSIPADDEFPWGLLPWGLHRRPLHYV